MSLRNPYQIPLKLAYTRDVMFAVELVDSVTLQRLSRNIQVDAEGLTRAPILNSSDIFVWLKEDFDQLKRLLIKPGMRPYEPVELEPNQISRPLTKISLAPRADYLFPSGITGLRGRLIESRFGTPTPVSDANVLLQWKGEDGVWRNGKTLTRTVPNSGDFVSFLRFGPMDEPETATSMITVRLQAKRSFSNRRSDSFQLHSGRITNPSTENQLVFAWDDLQL